MYRNVFIFLFLIGFNHVLNAQAFDTLLVQYQNISQIYPLADGSFILIGQGEESIVERIDSTGKSIWSVSMGLNYNDDDVLDDYAVHLTAQDSTIQIAVATKHCDYYDTTDVKVFTLNFDGLILDSLLVRARDFPLYITLLSGNPQYPRIAYAIDKYLVLLYADGDTSQLHVITPGLDSTIGDLDGPPVCAALSPEGTLLVGTRNGSLFRFKDDGTGYQFYIVRHFAFHSSGDFGLQKLFCLDEDYYILVYFNEISIYSVACCWHKSFFKSDGIFYEVKFISPNLQVMTDDSFYILDHFLDKIYAGPMPEYEQHISGFALRNQNLFTVGSGYFYREGGFLGSENLITHSGQKFYDIELVDFEVGPYDSVYFQNGRRYMYTIPNASVTIKNKGDFTIQQIQVGHTYSFSYCSDGSWEREIKNMDLSPGETKTYDLHDILIVIEYPFHGWLGACLYAIRPDDHADDHFGDNEVCKKVELLPSSVDLTELPIRHSPSTITDMIRFFAPQEYNFDLTIYNLNGIEVFSSHGNTATGYSIDLNFLPSGIYIFQYYLPVTQKRYVEKILKY